jgi:integrase
MTSEVENERNVIFVSERSVVTFAQRAELWLDSLATRKRKPVSPATLRAFGSYIRHLTPMIGDMRLVDVNNGALKRLVQQLDDEKLSPKTIGLLIAVVKQVVASLVDEETGEPLLRREWSAKHIDCPTIAKQKQPCVTTKDVERCLRESTRDQEKVLYAVLAGSGLRVAEALAIHVKGTEEQASWNPERQAIDVRSSIFNGREIPRVKTAAAKRTVDLDPRLSNLIARYVEINGIRQGDYLFQARSGRPMYMKTARQRLVKHKIPGFHSFRRYRITRLRYLGVPEDIIRYWVGHEGEGITDRYSKLGENVELRREWAHRAGLLGFDLPDLSKQERPAPKVSKTAAPAKSAASANISTDIQRPYVAEDSDLDEFFRSTPQLAPEEV